jgi:chromosomal replication initiation ATPase DnaA
MADLKRALQDAHRARRARIDARAQEEAHRRAAKAATMPRVRRILPSCADRREAALRAAFDAVPDVFKTRPAWKLIARQVCAAHDAPYDDVMSERRLAALVTVRHEIWYRMKTELNMSYPEIGGRFSRDHTTILHGVRKHADRLGQEYPQ